MEPEGRRVLVEALIGACAEEDVELTRFLAVIRSSNQKALVVVTTTDRATELLLEFLDSQRERGITAPVKENS